VLRFPAFVMDLVDGPFQYCPCSLRPEFVRSRPTQPSWIVVASSLQLASVLDGDYLVAPPGQDQDSGR